MRAVVFAVIGLDCTGVPNKVAADCMPNPIHYFDLFFYGCPYEIKTERGWIQNTCKKFQNDSTYKKSK